MNSHLDIYEKISSLFNIKFKSQITNLDLSFKNLFYLKNIMSNDEYYLLILNNQSSLKFRNKTEFLNNFSKFIGNEIETLDFEFKELNKSYDNRFKIDENQLYLEHERIGHNTQKLTKLLEKINKLKNE